jgi:hypothetical protein
VYVVLVELDRIVVPGFVPTVPLSVGVGLLASSHALTSGITSAKMFASVPMSENGGGRRGRLSPISMSIEIETFAAVSISGLVRLVGLVGLSIDGIVMGLKVLLLSMQLAAMFVESFASRRGRFMETAISAFILLLNSKPMGIVGLKARPSVMSALVALALMGRGVSDAPSKPSI